MLDASFVAEFFERMVLLLHGLVDFRIGNLWAGRRYLLHRFVEPWQVNEGVELVWLDKFRVAIANVIPVA